MKLVCFSNNTAGGLVCDLLNGTNNISSSYNTTGYEHSVFKLGDSDSVNLIVDVNKWNKRVEQFSSYDKWFGTHQHPSVIPDLTKFDSVISITTMNRSSKLYRWLRIYYGWFKPNHPLYVEDDSLESIDRARELAKNVFTPFTPYEGCINIEFSDIVNGDFVRQYNLNLDYFNKWLINNPWLYELQKYKWAVNRFNEAEYEVLNSLPFKYI